MTWNPDMDAAPKDRTVLWCYFPLEGLDNSWERVKAVLWNAETGLWTWEGRAYRAYSRGYDPTHWQLKLDDNPPEAPIGIC